MAELATDDLKLLLPETPPPPDGGVIGDARGRQFRRRRRVAGAVAVVLAGGALLGWASGQFGSSARAHPVRGIPRGLLQARERRRLLGAHISPALEGGFYGWAVVESDGGGCCTLPSESSSGAAIGAIAGWTGDKHEEAATALLSDRVTDVVFDGQPARVVTLARLPYGMRMVKLAFPRQAHHLFGEGAPAGLALGADARPIGYLHPSEGSVLSPVRWWQKPQPLPAGPCQLRAHGITGLEPEWGHVAVAIRPYPGRIMGRAFFSCIDSEYYLHGWPLETAILLDAQHPGRTPAAIPGMHPLPGAPGTFAAPGDWHGELVATRRGGAWLVVAGGSGTAQRLDVLGHLTASVSLRSH